MISKNNLIGNRVGRLIVTFEEKRQRPNGGCKRWALCRCDCGNEKWISIDALCNKKQPQQSCGCLRIEKTRSRSIKHGDTVGKFAPEYTLWNNMISRCHNPRVKSWKDYGARGIAVCDRWRCSYQDFLSDVGRRPDPALQIDRINNDGNYEPGNVRWATRREQRANRRDSVRA